MPIYCSSNSSSDVYGGVLQDRLLGAIVVSKPCSSLGNRRSSERNNDVTLFYAYS